jgi:glutaredoxin 3
MVTIYGKDGCPYTQAARERYNQQGTPYDYVDVKKDPAALQRMLTYTAGRRCVPVIVDNDQVTVGFGGT